MDFFFAFTHTFSFFWQLLFFDNFVNFLISFFLSWFDLFGRGRFLLRLFVFIDVYFTEELLFPSLCLHVFILIEIPHRNKMTFKLLF